jgi:hypothetical protein
VAGYVATFTLLCYVQILALCSMEEYAWPMSALMKPPLQQIPFPKRQILDKKGIDEAN